MSILTFLDPFCVSESICHLKPVLAGVSGTRKTKFCMGGKLCFYVSPNRNVRSGDAIYEPKVINYAIRLVVYSILRKSMTEHTDN